MAESSVSGIAIYIKHWGTTIGHGSVFFFGVQFSLKILRSADRMFFVILKLVNPIYNPHSSNIQTNYCVVFIVGIC